MHHWHVDFVADGVLLLAVEAFLAFLPLAGDHRNGFGGARHGAEAAGGALPALLVALSTCRPRKKPETAALRVAHGDLLMKNCAS
jgi:hypothetical protein